MAFVRNTENKIIGGVAAGIAAHFGLDPLILRIAFILATIWGFAGIVIYLILWLLMPLDASAKGVQLLSAELCQCDTEKMAQTLELAAKKLREADKN